MTIEGNRKYLRRSQSKYLVTAMLEQNIHIMYLFVTRKPTYICAESSLMAWLYNKQT